MEWASGTQPHYEAPSNLQIEDPEVLYLHQIRLIEYLKMHFVLYLYKGIKSDIKTCSIDRVYI